MKRCLKGLVSMILIVLIAFGFAACGGGGGGGGGGGVNEYRGVGFNVNEQQQINWTMVFTQDGANISGTLTYDDVTDPAAETDTAAHYFTGTISGQTLNMTWNGITASFGFSGSEIGGMFTDTNGDEIIVKGSLQQGAQLMQVGDPDPPAATVGDWAGTYSGDDTGTWTGTVNAQGEVNATAQSTVTGTTYEATGILNDDGYVLFPLGTVSEAAYFIGLFRDDGTADGYWMDVDEEGWGEWTGNKQ